MADRASRFVVRDAADSERAWIAEQLGRWWGSTTIVSRNRSWDTTRLPALVALDEDRLTGLATFELTGDRCHVLTLNAVESRSGAGSALLAGVAERATAAGCSRLWLITTNDNLDALRFYQRRGLRITAVHSGAVDDARAVKPSIPIVGNYGIEIHDEIELELRLDARALRPRRVVARAVASDRPQDSRGQ